jgi:uncharacterized protein YhaN
LRPGFPLKDADRLRVSRLQHAKIQALSGDKQAIVSQLERAERDLKNAGEELEVAILEADKTGEVLEVDGLESVLRQAQKQGDLEEEIGQKRTVHESARAKCDRDLNRLGLWQGTLMELESLALPTSETIERFDKAWTDLQHTAVTLAERLEKVRADIASCDREIEALLLAGSVPSETDLEEARAHRELGWQLIRKAWLDGTEPDAEAIAFAGGGCLDQAYEASVHKADEISDRLRREANRVTQKAQLLAARQQHDAAAGEIMGDIKGNEESFAGIGKNWSSLWAPITPLPPREMLGWLQKQTRLLESAENLRLQEKSINELEKRVAQHMEHLGFALTSLGEKVTTKSLAGMIQQGESVLKKLTETARRAAQLRSETAKLKKRKDSAQGDKEEAERKLADWQEAWGKALGEIGLSESASPAVANEYLAGCGDLTRTLSDAISLRNRISGIERDAAQFIKDAKSAVQTLAPDLLETTDEEAVTRLQARVTKTAQDAATRGALIKQRDDLAQELQNAGDKIESVTGRLAAMCREAGCARYDELPAIEERSRQAEARRARLVQLNERLQAESAGAPLEEFVAEIEKIDPDAAKAQIMEHETQIAQWEGKRSQAEQDLGSRETTLKSFDGNSRAAESAERMQSILADIEENQDQYIRLRLASTILRREIEKYRAENQDPLLTRAGEFFSALTLRSFQGIATDFDASDNPILKGVRPSGKLMTVEEMSEGSRDQLFFALQLASIEKFIGGCEPLPFIADDVLISFDQEREAAVLEVLGELSKKTQVIVFTHHRHLVEIAQRTLASEVLQVHELTALKAGS